MKYHLLLLSFALIGVGIYFSIPFERWKTVRRWKYWTLVGFTASSALGSAILASI